MILIKQNNQILSLSSVPVLSDDARIFIDECLLWDLSCDVLAMSLYKEDPKRFIERLGELDSVIERQVRNDDVPAFVDYVYELNTAQDVINGDLDDLISVFHEHYFGAGPFDSEEAFAKYYCEEHGYLNLLPHIYKYIDYELLAVDLFKREDMYMTANGYVFIFYPASNVDYGRRSITL